jgi:tRNA pseudouridine38-40 synthase
MAVVKNIKLVMEYDGTNYCGWQRQNNAESIQQKVEEAIQRATGAFSKVIGASRTDAGVHAKEFVCNFFTDSTIPSDNLKMVLNSFLPKDIVIVESKEVDKEFHSRYGSVGKKYIYTVLNASHRPAIERNYVYYFNRHLDIEKMKKASKYFLGTHDFSAFKKKGSSVKTSIRTIKELDIDKSEDYIKFSIIGDGFLYNMVRIIVGTLLEVGVGRFKPEDIVDIINSKDRSRAGKSVSACGLTLEKVFY